MTMSADEIHYEAGRIRNEDLWPHYPVLPVKNRLQRRGDGWPRLGVMFAGEGPKIFVDVNMNQLPKDLQGCTFEAFETYEALVEAGWEGD